MCSSDLILHVLAEGGILEDGEACDAAHCAGLDHGVAQVGGLDCGAGCDDARYGWL